MPVPLTATDCHDHLNPIVLAKFMRWVLAAWHDLAIDFDGHALFGQFKGTEQINHTGAIVERRAFTV
jgi:hypothetical protein